MNQSRTESDSMGAVEVDAARLWGAQTQRSLEHFAISTESMPPELIHALAMVKSACAQTNLDLGLLAPDKAAAIIASAAEVIGGSHAAEFPLRVWQTGSGTQTNMNMNEVLANRASELLGGRRGAERKVHPNDDVNRGQSSNDVFPTAMYLAAATGVAGRLLPALADLRSTFENHCEEFAGIIKIGRTHLQDATPLTLGQEFSGYASQLGHAYSAIALYLPSILELAIGATAVGTGLNTHPEFGARVANKLARTTGLPFVCAANRFSAIAAHDGMVAMHGALKVLAVAMTKIANDIRWLASGPRCGIGELHLPENEPGSSMMPGKVNPTQCEALTMLCCRVMGNDVSIAFAGASGTFELNVYKPVMAADFLQSLRLLTDGMRSFELHCVRGITADKARIAGLLERSLMLVTALVPFIGYDAAAAIAERARRDGLSLREAALASDRVSSVDFDRWVRPDQMV